MISIILPILASTQPFYKTCRLLEKWSRPLRRDFDSLVVGRLLLVLLLSEVLFHALLLKLVQTLQFLCVQHQL